MLRNVSTKSIVLAPFNSTLTHISQELYLREDIKDLIIDKKSIKFAVKAKEIDRQYEKNNNADLDNGVYHDNTSSENEHDLNLSPNKFISESKKQLQGF